MISKRLKSIANYIKKDDLICDIGCDHALLDIYLVKEMGLKNIIVSDILDQALNNAKKNIKKYGLEKEITPILSDGIKKIDLTNINTLVISGLGTKNIIKILRGIKKIKTIKKIIIQTNNDYYYLRNFLKKENFIIEDENVIKDKKINYITMKFKRGNKIYNYSDYYFGPILRKDKNNLWFFKECLENAIFISKNIPEKSYQKKLINKKIKLLNKIIKNLNK